MPTEANTVLSDEQVAEIATRRWVYSYDDERPDRTVPDSERTVTLRVAERDALCATVKALRAENEQIESRRKAITEDRNLLYTENGDLRERLSEVERERDDLRRRLQLKTRELTSVKGRCHD